LPATEHGAITPALLDDLRARPWRGNVRELRNFVERALTFGTDEALDLLPPPSTPQAARGRLPRVSYDEPFKVVRDRWIVHLEREYLRGVLARTGGNVSAAADAAGLDRAYVYRLIRKHGLYPRYSFRVRAARCATKRVTEKHSAQPPIAETRDSRLDHDPRC